MSLGESKNCSLLVLVKLYRIEILYADLFCVSDVFPGLI